MQFTIVRSSRILRGGGVRPCDKAVQSGDKWTIELASLEELMALQTDLGEELIISTCDGPEIEIYDDYR